MGEKDNTGLPSGGQEVPAVLSPEEWVAWWAEGEDPPTPWPTLPEDAAHYTPEQRAWFLRRAELMNAYYAAHGIPPVERWNELERERREQAERDRERDPDPLGTARARTRETNRERWLRHQRDGRFVAPCGASVRAWLMAEKLELLARILEHPDTPPEARADFDAEVTALWERYAEGTSDVFRRMYLVRCIRDAHKRKDRDPMPTLREFGALYPEEADALNWMAVWEAIAAWPPRKGHPPGKWPRKAWVVVAELVRPWSAPADAPGPTDLAKDWHRWSERL